MTNDQISVKGIVVSSASVGEYDKRMTILTDSLGRISAFARGAKRPNSILRSSTEPFSFGEFILYRGRSAYNVGKINVTEHFERLHEDFDSVLYGSYFLEIADYFGRENMEAVDQLTLIYYSLKALGDERFDNRLVRAVYELRTLGINGEAPDVTACRSCGRSDRKLIRFFSERNGLLCVECDPGKGGIVLSEGCVYTMNYIINSPLNKLFSFKVSEDVLLELCRAVTDYYRRWVDRRFKSLSILENEI
ncbi:MAG: DNA repair protein RecO [Eubacterium sp.]|nr:DNA repair protein RecO [Eubacterium sp.]